jgi:adenylate cyclase
MKKKHLFYLITLASILLFATLQLLDNPMIQEKVEGRTFDLRLNLRDLVNPQPSPKDIIIVSIDEKSIKEIGRWPWRRDVMAILVHKISEDRPKVIGIDIIFSERESRETDAELEKAIKEAGNVVLATAFIVPKGKNVVIPGEVPNFFWDSAMNVKSVEGIKWKKWALKPESAIPPLEEFSRVASLGHVYTQPDLDGTLRREVMYLNYGIDCYPSFALQIARIACGLRMEDMVLFGGSQIMLGNRYIPIDLSGRVLINYVGKEHSFPYKSASDVINGKTATGLFRDKIVLIGTSALATYDQKITPLSANMPGVEKNANVVENIILNNFLIRSPGILELIVIVMTGVLLGVLIPRLKAIPGVAISIGSIVFYILLSFYLLTYKDIWINLIYPVSNMFVIFIALTVAKYFFEEKKAKEIRSMFSSYVSPKIVEVLINNPEKAKLGGVRKDVSVLFADIIGFTTLSERKPPEEVIDLLNEYFKEMTDIIFKWDGTLDKFVGDEIMAFWGAPVDQPNHAELAVRCALNMTDRLSELQKKWTKEGKEVLDCGIGINTGEVIIGNIGAIGKKMDYTVMGDHVNLAARVEKLTREYNAKIIVTEFTIGHLDALIKEGLIGHCQLEERDNVRVKGKEKEVKIFELKGLKHGEI